MTGKRQIITPVTFFIVTVAIDEHGDDKVQFDSGKKIDIVWWLVIHYESLALGHNTRARNFKIRLFLNGPRGFGFQALG